MSLILIFVFVCIGTNFQSSLEITSLLKELGAKYVISQATRDIHAKFLLKNGADEVIYPNRDSAEKLAVRVSNDNLYDYVELDNEYSIYEIPALRQWLGKTIKQINIRAAFHIYIIGIKKDNKTDFLPSVDYVFNVEDHLLVIGKKKDVDMILKCMS